MRKAKTSPLNPLFEKQAPPKMCAWEQCSEEAHYPAPKHRNIPDSLEFSVSYSRPKPEHKPEMQWFCLDHIREFNASWNFFSGMSEQEIIDFQEDAITGHRKTRPITQGQYPNFPNGLEVDELMDRFVFLDDTDEKSKSTDNEALFRAVYSRLTSEEQRALDVLGVVWPLTALTIKQRYKELVKQYHPDRHMGEASIEERFKAINAAYHLLKINGFMEKIPA